MQNFKECLDDLKSKRVLIIHGFNSSGNGTTASNLKSVLSNFGITKIIAPNFNLLNYNETIAKTDELSKNVDIVIGHSLGGYYTMGLEIFKIVINPCINPLVINLDLNKKINLRGLNRQLTFGMFAKSDELFDFCNYFKDNFSAEFYDVLNYARIPGGHRPDKDSLKLGLIKEFEYFTKIHNSIDLASESENIQ